VFTLFRGLTYNLKVQKGGMVHEASITCNNPTEEYKVPLTTLTVDFTGVKNVDKTTVSVGSTSVVSKEWANDKAEFTLFKGLTYNLKVQKGGMVHETDITIDNNEEKVTYDVPLTTLTVDFTGVKNVNKITVSVGSTSVTSKEWVDDKAEFTLFKGLTYNLKVQKGGMVHEKDITIDNEEEKEVTYNVPLTTLTVDFTGVKNVNKITVSVNSTQVTYKEWVNDKAEFTLFKGLTYNLKIQKGGMVHEGSITCDDPTEEYKIPLTTLTVDFTGVKNVNKITVSVNSTQVTYKEWVSDSTTFILFTDKENPYTLKLQKGTMVHEGSIICDESKEIYVVPTHNGTF